MSEISTISEFLLQSGCQYRVFDLGRGIRKLKAQEFMDIEANKVPHPYPRLGLAWFGIVFWNKQLSDQQYIWFLKLPLDEQGLLSSAARNQFLNIVVEALGAQMEVTKADSIPENPYTFTPGQQQMADFNSMVRKALSMPPSSFYEQACDYIRDPQAHDWQQLPLQGLADVIARLEETSELLCEQFESLNDTVQHSLLNSMENQPLGVSLTETLLDWIQRQPDNTAVHVALLRALTQSQARGLVHQHIARLLDSPMGAKSDCLIVISGRHWDYLEDEERLYDFMERLAKLESNIFVAVFADIVRLPSIRDKALAQLRRPDRSPQLSQAIEHLFRAMPS
ncbi:hypothetical protein HMF8227_02162 [Saliniradius amylolyticus]|uniref:DUF3549 domain-containing protein n=1 Tax=Saliniradius amylolyticus TaxID=2183582 RepID=A0A2S2E5W1_9ALTE|nr:DUF3549 family protein [Saliniradius amylolyticus]AWL12620.1 hypothetical protein HMF8227_02162 [Saliniradius amylolyticus]